MTYREGIFALIEAHKKSFATSDIKPVMALFYIQIVANRILSKEIEEDANAGYYVTRFLDLPIQTDTKGYKYIDVPQEVLNMKRDLGIEAVTYSMDPGKCPSPTFASVQFSRTTVSESRRLYYVPEEKPSTKNPYIYVIKAIDEQGNKIIRIYTLGLECAGVSHLDAYMACAINTSTVCNLDEQIPIPGDQEIFLIQDALRLLRFSAIFPEDRINDGEDTAGDQDASYTPTTAGNSQEQK